MITTTQQGSPLTASRTSRLGGYFIDITIFIMLDLFTIVPVIGALIDFLLLFYMLLRDASGASIGKRLVGLRIIDRATGGPASTSQCIARNIVFAVPLLIQWVPILGFFIGNGFLIGISLVELAMLFVTGRRLGDLLADTEVVKHF